MFQLKTKLNKMECRICKIPLLAPAMAGGTCGSRYCFAPQPVQASLTKRQRQILLKAGKSAKETAKELSIDIRTVQSHNTRIFSMLEVDGKTAAVIVALRRGLITLEELEV